MSWAVSSNDFVSLLGFFFSLVNFALVIVYLLHKTVRYCAIELCVIRFEPPLCNVPQGPQFVVIDVLALAFGEAVKEYRPVASPIRDQHAVTARPALSLSGDPLFDDVTTQVSIHKAAVRALYRFAQAVIADPFPPRITHKPFRFKNSQTTLITI
jgi:hypothetical protein